MGGNICWALLMVEKKNGKRLNVHQNIVPYPDHGISTWPLTSSSVLVDQKGLHDVLLTEKCKKAKIVRHQQGGPHVII